MRRDALSAVLAGLLVVGAPAQAQANGRFPRAQRLLELGEPRSLLLAATYGLLVTHDRGASWRHICELSYAFSIDDLDPLVGLSADGSLLVTGTHSLNRSAPPFCEFRPMLGGAGNQRITDFSSAASDPDRVLASFLESAGGTLSNQIYESTDGGKTFTPLGVPLPQAEVAVSLTLDAAPSDPRRLYLTTIDHEGNALFARSDDRGASWSLASMPTAPAELAFIAAVDVSNPDILYVRTDGWEPGSDRTALASDALLYSDDAGQSWREIHRAGGKLFGFALAPDSSEVLLGYGDPVEAARSVDPAALGVYRAAVASGHEFTKIFAGPVSCLRWTATGVYVCTSQVEHGYALGFAPSPDFELASPEPLVPLLRLTDVSGPIECPACSSGAACDVRWQDNCALFANCDAGIAGANGSAGSDCTGMGGGGNSGPGAASGTAPAAGGAAPQMTRDPASCACRAAGSGRHSGFAGALGAVALAGLRRRCRRSDENPQS